MSDTDVRASLLELDLPSVDTAEAVTPEASEEKPLVAGVDIVAGAKAKSAEEMAMVKEVLGVEAPSTFYESGTKMLDSGEERAYQLRAQWENRPLVADAMDALVKTVVKENRRDVISPIAMGRVDGDGFLRGIDGKLLNFTERAWVQLQRYAPERVPSKLRSNVNYWMGDMEKELRWRTRYPKGRSADCYSVVSKRYQPFDEDRVAAIVQEHMPKDSRATVIYDGTRTSIDVSLANPYEIAEEMGVGRLHRVGVRVDTSNDGTGGLRIRAFAERIACINCTIMANDELVIHRRHIGSVDSFVNDVTQAVSQLGGAMDEFSALWREANEKRIHDTYNGTPLSAEEVFKRLVVQGYVHVPGVKSSKMVTLLMREWEQEPGDTAAAVNRAVTRLANGGGGWKSQWYNDELEQMAGELLYQQVYSLRPLTDTQVQMFEREM